MTDLLKEYKKDQDKLNERKRRLSEVFTSFSEAFLDEFKQFTERALNEKLEGTQALVIAGTTNDATIAQLGLNGFEVVLISTNYCSFLEPGRQAPLASKIFVYLSTLPEAEPVIEILVRENSETVTGFSFSAKWTPDMGGDPIDGAPQVDETRARRAANEIIYRVYKTLKRHWSEEAELGKALESIVKNLPQQVDVKSRVFGFHMSKIGRSDDAASNSASLHDLVYNQENSESDS